MKQCGIATGDETKRKLEEEINGLYDRLAGSLRQENARLTEIIKKLSDENSLLKLQIKNLRN